MRRDVPSCRYMSPSDVSSAVNMISPRNKFVGWTRARGGMRVVLVRGVNIARRTMVRYRARVSASIIFPYLLLTFSWFLKTCAVVVRV